MKAVWWMTLVASALIGLFLLIVPGCTPAQRAKCAVCKATGLCRILGDDPNLSSPTREVPLIPLQETK
jgi:hypothetical protein